ncbi:MAG TPA: hypothetical protein VFG32_04225 [Bacteroidota bacterium]|nr:hypothetical protein [Bacteroidota bacterium]
MNVASNNRQLITEITALDSQKWFVRALVWMLALTLLIGCQADSLNAPAAPDAGTQTKSIVHDEIGQSSTTSPIGDLVGGAGGLLRRVLGIVTGLVTPSNGGTLDLLHSRFVVPPNAVTRTTLIEWVLRVEIPNGLQGALNRIYDFGPEGVVFQVPGTLYVSFGDAGLGNNDPYLYTFYYFNESTRRWEPQSTDVDVAHQRFVVTLHHFSRYAFGR